MFGYVRLITSERFNNFAHGPLSVLEHLEDSQPPRFTQHAEPPGNKLDHLIGRSRRGRLPWRSEPRAQLFESTDGGSRGSESSVLTESESGIAVAVHEKRRRGGNP